MKTLQWKGEIKNCGLEIKIQSNKKLIQQYQTVHWLTWHLFLMWIGSSAFKQHSHKTKYWVHFTSWNSHQYQLHSFCCCQDCEGSLRIFDFISWAKTHLHEQYSFWHLQQKLEMSLHFLIKFNWTGVAHSYILRRGRVFKILPHQILWYFLGSCGRSYWWWFRGLSWPCQKHIKLFQK